MSCGMDVFPLYLCNHFVGEGRERANCFPLKYCLLDVIWQLVFCVSSSRRHADHTHFLFIGLSMCLVVGWI